MLMIVTTPSYICKIFGLFFLLSPLPILKILCSHLKSGLPIPSIRWKLGNMDCEFIASEMNQEKLLYLFVY